MIERGVKTWEDSRGSSMAFKEIRCRAKRHQKAISHEQEQSITLGEESLGKCGVLKYSVYKD